MCSHPPILCCPSSSAKHGGRYNLLKWTHGGVAGKMLYCSFLEVTVQKKRRISVWWYLIHCKHCSSYSTNLREQQKKILFFLVGSLLQW